MRETQNLLIAVGRRFESYTKPSFCLFEEYFYFFLFILIELLFVRDLESVCEAQLRLCVIIE